MFVVDFASSVFFCFFLKKFSYLLSGFSGARCFFLFASSVFVHLLLVFIQRISPGSRDCTEARGRMVEGGPAAGGAEASSLFSGLTCCFTCTAAAAGPEAAAPPPPPPPAPPPLTSTGVEAASPEAGDADLGRVSVF